MIRALVADAVTVVRSVFEWRRPVESAWVSALDAQRECVENARRWSLAEWVEEFGVDFWTEESAA